MEALHFMLYNADYICYLHVGRSFVDQSTHDTHFIDPYFCDSSVFYFFLGRNVCNAMQSVNYPK